MISALFDHLWQSTLFVLFLAALTCLLKTNTAGSRYWLWFAASLKFLLPFSLLADAGGLFFSPAISSLPETVPFEMMEQAALPFSAAEPVLTMHDTGLAWIPILAAIWLIGCATVLLIWTRYWYRVRAALRGAVPVALSVPLPVLESPSFLEPGLVGIWRPVLLLPKDITLRLSQEEMAAVIAHELCHFRRRDNLTAAIHMLVEALFWFHPLVWWLGTRLIAERERACDEYVVASGNDPKVYAESILKVCKHYLHSPLACTSGVSGADLRTRIETIMADCRAHRLGIFKKSVLALAAATVLATPVIAGVMAEARDPIFQVSTPQNVARNITEQARKRVAVAFNPSDFDKFVGHYQGDTIISVSRQGGRYFTSRTLGVKATRLTPHPFIEVFPESENKFFASDVIAQYSFVTDAGGRVNGLVFHQSGLNRLFRKITSEEARALEAAVLQRISQNKPSPGTQEALRNYILAMQEQRPDYDAMAPGILVRSRLGSRATLALMQKLGALKFLTFKGVAPDGMDTYHTIFANGVIDWSLPPLNSQGKIIWIGRAAAVDE